MKKIIVFAFLLLAFPAMTARAEYIDDIKDIRYAPARADLPEGEYCSDRVMDIYYPVADAPAKGYPVVVFIHGGGYAAGTKDRSRGLDPLFSGFLDNGYAVVSINYFLGKKYIPRNERTPNFWSPFRKDGVKLDSQGKEVTGKAAEDASLALRWIGKQGRKYYLDKDNIFLCGGSAGAMNSLFTAFVTKVKHPAVKGVVNMWGALPDRNMIKTDKIAVLTLHGDADNVVSVEHGKAIQERLEELGNKDSKLVILPGLGHAAYLYVGNDYMDEVIPFLKNLTD